MLTFARHDSLPQKETRQRPDGRGKPRPHVETGRREHALQGGCAQRKSRTHGIRPSVRAPHVPRHESRARFRPAGADGFGRQQRLHQQRLHRLLHHPADGQHRNGPVARKRPHGRAEHHAREAGDREKGGHRRIPATLSEPALRRPDAAAAGPGLQGAPLPLGRHRPHARPHSRSDACRCRNLLPCPLPPVERHSVDLGRPGRGADDRPGRKMVRRAARPALDTRPHPAGTSADEGPAPGSRTRRSGHDLTVAYPMGGRTSPISTRPTWFPTCSRAAIRRASTNGWSRNDGCSRRSTPTSRATRTRGSSYSRGSCSRRRRPKQPKRPSAKRSEHSAGSAYRTTKCRKSRTNSKQTPFSAN